MTRSMLISEIYVLDLLSTAVFAFAGAAIAQDRGHAFVVVALSGTITAVGGGTLRHWLIEPDSLFWLEDLYYLLVSLAAVGLVYVPTFKGCLSTATFQLLDNLSTGLFIAIGYTVAHANTDSTTLVVLLAILSGVGGGLIRDACLRAKPRALSDALMPCYLFASLVGIYAVKSTSIDIWVGSCAGIMAVEITRLIVVELKPRLRREVSGNRAPNA